MSFRDDLQSSTDVYKITGKGCDQLTLIHINERGEETENHATFHTITSSLHLPQDHFKIQFLKDLKQDKRSNISLRFFLRSAGIFSALIFLAAKTPSMF